MSESTNIEMNEQLEFMEQNKATISVGRIVKGTIISVNEKEAYVNIGYKSDGYLPKSEVTKDESIRLTDILKVGQEIEIKVISRSNEDGYVVLSRIEIERESAYKEIKSAFENNDIITAVVKDAVSGGLVASYNGVRIFIPASHIELFHVDDLEQFKGKEFEIKIIELKEDRRGTKIVGSRKESNTLCV